MRLGPKAPERAYRVARAAANWLSNLDNETALHFRVRQEGGDRRIDPSEHGSPSDRRSAPATRCLDRSFDAFEAALSSATTNARNAAGQDRVGASSQRKLRAAWRALNMPSKHWTLTCRSNRGVRYLAALYAGVLPTQATDGQPSDGEIRVKHEPLAELHYQTLDWG